MKILLYLVRLMHLKVSERTILDLRASENSYLALPEHRKAIRISFSSISR